MSSWLSSTFSKMLLSLICSYLIHLGPISKAVARPNLWPAGETLPSSLHVSSQAVDTEKISGLGNAALERGNIQRHLLGNEPMPQQPNSITLGIDKHDQGKYAQKLIIQYIGLTQLIFDSIPPISHTGRALQSSSRKETQNGPGP